MLSGGRLERDLHDGAQQRLVSIGLALRHVQGLLQPGGEATTEVDATVTELTDAIEELRELARGVRPAGLDDGLATALQELATRSPLRTMVEATGERFEDRSRRRPTSSPARPSRTSSSTPARPRSP